MSASLHPAYQAFAAALTGQQPLPEGLLRPLRGQPPQLAVYQHAWLARLAAALRDNYPVLHRVLGDVALEALTRAYAQAHPPTEPSIRWFGAQLADFLDQQPEHCPHPALGDLARMEWALGCAFDSADTPPHTAAALQATPVADWPALRWQAHPSVRLLQLRWAVAPLWRALRTDDPEADAPAPEPLTHRLLVWREGLDTRWRSLEAAEAQALEALLRGLSFGPWCEQLLASSPLPADAAMAEAVGWLRRWIDDGMLCAAPVMPVLPDC